MRVFVYELLCAGGCAGQPPSASLRREGLAMLAAVLEDFTRMSGIEAITLVDGPTARRLGKSLPLRRRSRTEADDFLDLAAWADYTMVIAPECDDILETRCRWAREAGTRLLGPSPDAVRLAGDKWHLGRYLHDRDIPVPACHLIGRATAVHRGTGQVVPRELSPTSPLVIKPRHGAGSQATFLVTCQAELVAGLDRARRESADDLLVQPFVAGLPASVAFLLGPNQRQALPPAVQHFSRDGHFHYLGGALPLPPDLSGRARKLAERAVQAVPGLRGYVGVDLVLGSNADGSLDQVIEINPRLTTSYVGLRALAAGNLADALLRIVRGQSGVKIPWRPRTVEFAADGQWSYVAPRPGTKQSAAHCHPGGKQPQ